MAMLCLSSLASELTSSVLAVNGPSVLANDEAETATEATQEAVEGRRRNSKLLDLCEPELHHVTLLSPRWVADCRLAESWNISTRCSRRHLACAPPSIFILTTVLSFFDLHWVGLGTVRASIANLTPSEPVSESRSKRA